MSDSFELGWLCTSIIVLGKFGFELVWKQVLLQFCDGLIGVLFMFDLRLKEGDCRFVDALFDFLKVHV